MRESWGCQPTATPIFFGASRVPFFRGAAALRGALGRTSLRGWQPTHSTTGKAGRRRGGTGKASTAHLHSEPPHITPLRGALLATPPPTLMPRTATANATAPTPCSFAPPPPLVRPSQCSAPLLPSVGGACALWVVLSALRGRTGRGDVGRLADARRPTIHKVQSPFSVLSVSFRSGLYKKLPPEWLLRGSRRNGRMKCKKKCTVFFRSLSS